MEHFGLILVKDSHYYYLNLGGKSIIEHCIESMIESVSEIIILCEKQNDRIDKIVKRYYKVSTVYHKDLKDVLATVKENRIFINLANCPLVRKETYETLETYTDDIVIPTYQGKSGHPILITKKIIEDLNGDFYNTLKNKPNRFVELNDRGIVINIDTMDDYLSIYRNFCEM